MVDVYLKCQPSDQQDKVSWSTECLLIEGLGMMALAAEKCGKSKQFRAEQLASILAFVLSQTNLANSHSAHVLYFALNDLATGCEFPTIVAMLEENADVLCRELTILLRVHLSASRRKNGKKPMGLPTLLRAVMKLHRDLDRVPELKDAVDALLLQLDLSWVDPDPRSRRRSLKW